MPGLCILFRHSIRGEAQTFTCSYKRGGAPPKPKVVEMPCEVPYVTPRSQVRKYFRYRRYGAANEGVPKGMYTFFIYCKCTQPMHRMPRWNSTCNCAQDRRHAAQTLGQRVLCIASHAPLACADVWDRQLECVGVFLLPRIITAGGLLDRTTDFRVQYVLGNGIHR